MHFVLVTKDAQLAEAARQGLHPDDHLVVLESWEAALDVSPTPALMFVDQLATLTEAHRIAGYEEFASAKMIHPRMAAVPLVLISPPADYDLDYIVGWPDFLFGQLQRPVDYRAFRRASTWI